MADRGERIIIDDPWPVDQVMSAQEYRELLARWIAALPDRIDGVKPVIIMAKLVDETERRITDQLEQLKRNG